MNYNNLDKKQYHGIFADGFADTGYIPADNYVAGKWCVSLDLRLYDRWAWHAS